jgi:hypothetical protein
MKTKTSSILLIVIGSAFLLAALGFWIDTKTSADPAGLGQQIRDWLTAVTGIVSFIKAYQIRKGSNKPTNSTTVYGGNPQMPSGDHSRSIQVDGTYIENIENVENLNILSPLDEEKEKRKYELRNKHEFTPPRYLYKPIQDTISEFQEKLEKNEGGYIGVLGPPGSGKSTFLTQTLRTLPFRAIRYYAYVPDAQDPSILRGEAINFFHDVTLEIQDLRGTRQDDRPDPTDRIALNEFFYEQLAALGNDFQDSGISTVILVDGLDHIAREQNPDRSLIADLPLPEKIPAGVFVVLGSQTLELLQLSPEIKQELSKEERIVRMGKLSPQSVSEIVDTVLGEIEHDFAEKIYNVVDGHPLALIYLLNALGQADSQKDYTIILDETTPYKGNIEKQYFAHWLKIEEDQEFKEFLGLLARIRGPIPMKWVAQWAEKSLLEKLKKVWGQYFVSDSMGRWEFFHNSFKIFLEEKTADNLPGLTSAQIDQQYHLELAQKYKGSDSSWKWETLYHYYKTENHEKVLEIAQYDWFKEQVEAFRPIDAIETDVRLAVKSAGILLDAVALLRLTLVGASLQQRANALEDTELPYLLLETGHTEIATDYARDGVRLRLADKAALSFARDLVKVNPKEARRVFELAEPLEELSGRLVLERNGIHREIDELLEEWIISAGVFHSPDEIVEIVRRIKREPDLHKKDLDVAIVSRRLQNWLLHNGALGSCERDDWHSWEILFGALEEEKDGQTRYYTLLRTIEILRSNGEKVRAQEMLSALLKFDELEMHAYNRTTASNILSIAEAIYFLGIDHYEELARHWVDKIDGIPLSDDETDHSGHLPHLISIQFRYARLSFALDPSCTPHDLLKYSEEKTVFGDYEDEDERLVRRQTALIAYTLAKLWVAGYMGEVTESGTFVQNIKWVFKLLDTTRRLGSGKFYFHTLGLRGEIAYYIVASGIKHGQGTIQALKTEFSSRWEPENTSWGPTVQREVILGIVKHDKDFDWAKKELWRLQGTMLNGNGLDLDSRVKECEKQANAWLAINEKELATSTLSLLVKSARGIYSEKDYQLFQWANWLRKTNATLNDGKELERIQTFIGQVLSVEDTTSRGDDALLVAIQSVFDTSPHKAIQLYKKLLERKSVSFSDGLMKILFSMLKSENSPYYEIYGSIKALLLPFSQSAHPELIKEFIIASSLSMGKPLAIKFANGIVDTIKTNSLRDIRAGWIDGVVDALSDMGETQESVDLLQGDIPSVSLSNTSSSLDENFYLFSGEKFSLEQLSSKITTVEDLRWFLENEKKKESGYFRWAKLASDLFIRLATVEQIEGVCSLMEERIDSYSKETYLAKVYTGASKRLFDLGHLVSAKDFAQKAFGTTTPSGWYSYYDGGAKYAAVQQFLAVMGDDSREKIIELFAQDLSENHRYSEELARGLDDIAQVLFKEIPYVTLWPDLENYLGELFDGVVIKEYPDLDTIWDNQTDIERDDAVSAIAELLILFLDFPAYPVSNGAIQVLAKSVLADNHNIKEAVLSALRAHDQVVIQALKTLEVVSIEAPDALSFFQEELKTLQKSPNINSRLIATKIMINILGEQITPPQLGLDLPAIYSIHLPDIALHKTNFSDGDDAGSVLLDDPALLLRPLDFDAREIAKRAGVPENNLLYRTIEKFREIETKRTWLSNGAQLKPRELSVFLDQIGLNISHRKPKISPATNSVAQTAAELYDAGNLSVFDLSFLEMIFRDYDPHLFWVQAHRRPEYISNIGGLGSDLQTYLTLPKDWGETIETSLPLLKGRSPDGWIILAEWTHLRRLQDKWPSEERLSVTRAVPSYEIWTDANFDRGGISFSNTHRLYMSDYLNVEKYLEREFVIAHNGFTYDMETANWLALNPRVGFDLGWKPVDQKSFSWKDKADQLVAKSVYWQDGNPVSASWRAHEEVGYGWVVLITDKGYQELCRRYGVISRGGFVRRSLGQFGATLRTSTHSALETP